MKTSDIKVEPLSEAVGARITGLDLRQEYDDATADFLRQAFARYSVLCFPDQDIDDEDQIRFAALFGKVDADSRTRATAPVDGAVVSFKKRGIMYISNLRENNKPIGDLPDGELQFHSDGSHRNSPYRATTLYAIKVTSVGGETKFAGLAAAFEALPEDIRKRIDGRQASHVYDRRAYKREEVATNPAELTTAIHDLVRVHPDTGRKSLYLSRLMTRDIIGMETEESDPLIEFLCAHAEKPEFVYVHRWTPRDLLIWDNRAVNHARNDFPPTEQRHMRRITISEPDARTLNRAKNA